MDKPRRGAGAPPHYPWHQWADGSAWKVLWGEDYYVSDKAFQAAAYAHAKSHGLIVTTRSIEGGLIIQFARRRQRSCVQGVFEPRERRPQVVPRPGTLSRAGLADTFVAPGG